MNEFTVAQNVKDELAEYRDDLEAIVDSGALTSVVILDAERVIKNAYLMTDGTWFSARFKWALAKIKQDDEQTIWQGIYDAIETIDDYLSREVTE